MYDNQGYENYRKLVKKLLRKVKKLDYKYDLSTTLLMMTKTYESLLEDFPKCKLWITINTYGIEEINFTFYLENAEVYLRTGGSGKMDLRVNKSKKLSIIDMTAYKELWGSLIFALKYSSDN